MTLEYDALNECVSKHTKKSFKILKKREKFNILFQILVQHLVTHEWGALFEDLPSEC